MPKETNSDRLRDLLISEFSEVNNDLDAALAEFEKAEAEGNAAIERSEAILRTLRR